MSGSAINRNPGADLLRSGTLVRAPGEGEPPQPSVRQCTQSRQADRQLCARCLDFGRRDDSPDAQVIDTDFDE